MAPALVELLGPLSRAGRVPLMPIATWRARKLSFVENAVNVALLDGRVT